MADLEDLRQRIDDLPKYRHDVKTADGTATKFQVSKYPIEPSSGTIAVGGSVYGSSGYTLNGTSGVADFLGTAPADDSSVIAEYTCTQLNGTHLQDILTRNGGILDLAAAEALEVRAAGAAAFFSFISADVKIDKKGIAAEYRALARQIRNNYLANGTDTTDTTIEMTYMDQDQPYGD